MAKELDEKNVADDGVSSVPEPVTPEGGKANKKPKKAPPADTVEEEAEKLSIDESIAAMFEGTDISDEFKDKATLVFEAAVNSVAASKTADLTETLTEEFEANIAESVESAMSDIIENLDTYLDYVVEQWMEENTVAIESGIKVEMAESLMSSLKDIYEEHNIEVSDETVDVVSALEEEALELTAKTNSVIDENIELQRENRELKANKVFAEISEGLTVSQKEKLETLSENLDVSDLTEYSNSLNTLKESFFRKKVEPVVEHVEDELLMEQAPVTYQHDSVKAIIESLNKAKN